MGQVAPAHTIEFRVVASEGERHAFKLERIFWTLLEAAASGDQERLGAYITKVLSNGDGAQNKSSLLRAHAADWMRRKLGEVSATSLARRSLGSVVLAAPTPCFVITPQNTIDLRNAAFMELLQAQSEADPTPAATVRVSFQTDIKTLRQAAHNRTVSTVTDKVAIHVGMRASHHQARIALLDSVNGQPVGMLVFLTT